MQLTTEQQAVLDGKNGEATAQSMRILVALGEIYGAKRMIPVSSVQVAGVSFHTIGQAGLEYLQDLASKGGQVKVRTFLNPAGMDREQWKAMGVPAEFAKKQLAVLEAYEKMGIESTCTCTPYFVGLRPGVGEHVAWSESSAVSFSNSVLGARTNREGGPSALAAAICGCTPEYGLHLEENRIAKVRVVVKAPVKTMADFGALGAFVAPLCKNRHPAFEGIAVANEDRLKALGASMAAAGAVALYYVKGITPEYKVATDAEIIEVNADDIARTRKKLGTDQKPQLVAIGCPHASIDEIAEVAKKVKGRQVDCQLWVCTARKTKQEADKLGYTAIIEKAGGRVVADTCMVVCPLQQIGFSVTAVNSGKAAAYLPTMVKQQVVFGDVEDIICLK